MDSPSIRAIVISVSDTRSEADDLSGAELVRLLDSAGAIVDEKIIVSDDLVELREAIFRAATQPGTDLVITTGGTGFADRDNTPEATRSVIEREAPGLAEAMRGETASRTPLSMLSRGICGIRGRTLIVNLPGSPKAVRECFDVIRPVLGHAVAVLRGREQHD
jgi:molybdopterin adenylyltransferase